LWFLSAAGEIVTEKISVILIVGNEEKNIVDCLESIKWADEIIVVDSQSSDSTVELAHKYTGKIFVKEWQGFAEQKAYSLSLAANEWVLSIDADERVSSALKTEIMNLNFGECNGYKIPRENYFLGKRITTCGWDKDRQMRLFRKSKTRLSDNLVHEGFLVEGKTGSLKNHLIHYTHTSIESTLKKINTYSSLQAEEYVKKKKSSASAIILHSIAAFLRSFISLKGYKDGVHGLMISMFNSVTTMLVYMKLWELQNLRIKTKTN